ncbi:hypothetical protein J8I26_21220 [Herbaspirillum sp. LeCh32-8]|uniref:hypothetical protein n=1 Tax=Herbaspirillum sp. LeCh32-8 TaxID=2821356 RepID=UPI001AE582B2|nr:hypothetical protein [Herbaspirillum sp. LeCh32-8]MBP0600648.1 hypothetical protein [Herbaspirillum sp. LeCh32-8]
MVSPNEPLPEREAEGKREARHFIGALAGEVDSCQQACLHCHEVCRKIAFDVSAGAGQGMRLDDVRLLFECAELCQLSANWQLSGSQYCRQICAVCAQLCRECESRCAGKMNMEECEYVCRRCAESCEAMAAMA